MDNDSVILIFQGGNGTFDRKSRIHPSDIDFLPNCSSADVCNSVWYCFENPFITAIGITASFFAAVGLLANSLSLYKICRRGVKLSPTMTMIGVLSASNCISMVVSYLPFLAHFGYLADSEHVTEIQNTSYLDGFVHHHIRILRCPVGWPAVDSSTISLVLASSCHV